MPTTNCGAETAVNEATISDPVDRAAAIGGGDDARRVSPISSSTTMAPAMSCSVAGRRDRISVATSVFWM